MSGKHTDANELFTDLFVLELANNHWGSVERGKEIIRQHGNVVKETGVKAAVKFQFRDVDSFVHDAFKPKDAAHGDEETLQAPGSSSRYIKKTLATKLTPVEFTELLEEVRAYGMYTMATPFDERSVGWCRDLDIDIVKIASQDAKSWVLVERIAELGKPTIVSNGGTDIADLDRLVALFKEKNVPLAINHCVSLYPSEDDELELNQVDYLRNRYPDNVIGYSTHEYHDWFSSVQITYAKGARTWERHIDIEDAEGTPVSPYCTLPHQVRVWFEAFKKAKEMTGQSGKEPRFISEKERVYVQSVSRGAYALADLPPGHILTKSNVGTDFEFVIPLQGDQLSSRDLDEDVVLCETIQKGDPVTFSKIAAPSPWKRTRFAGAGMRLAFLNGAVRAMWILCLIAAAVLGGFWIASIWTLLLSAAFALVVGFVLTKHHRYELFPGFLRTTGSFINGLILGGVLVSMIGMVYFGAPFYMPFVVFAISMVVTALLSRARTLLSRTGIMSYLLGLALLMLAVGLIGYGEQFGPVWLYFAYAVVLLTAIEQLNIKLGRTGLLLPWVQLFWQGIALLGMAVVFLMFLPQPFGIVMLLSTPMLVGVVCALSACMLIVSVATRIRMRRAAGLLAHQRMVVVAVLAGVGGAVSFLYMMPLLFAGLLVAALAFGDRAK